MSERELSATSRARNHLMARLPLEDVKILDFMWVMAGPAGTRMLADYGARDRAHRVADSGRHCAHAGAVSEQPDRARCVGAVQQLQRGQVRHHARYRKSALARGHCRSGQMGRRGHGVVLSQGDARVGARLSGASQNQTRHHHAEQLPDGADRSAREFRRLWKSRGGDFRFSQPHRMARSAARPDPLARTPIMFRRASPRSRFWPRSNIKRRTGKGQYIDQSQAEASLHFLTPALLDYSANGRVDFRAGNSDPDFAPHGVYPSKGEDRWVAIVCKTEDDFSALCDLMKRPELARDRALQNFRGPTPERIRTG